MPLTDFQGGVARLLAVNRSSDSYLAGGAAMHIEPNSKRYSNALDYFHDSEQRVAVAVREDTQLLEKEGYQVEILIRQPVFTRALVRKGDEATKLEWAQDSAWRFLPTVRDDRSGYQLSSIDLAIDKLLALVGRDEPRDYLDVHEAMSLLPLGALCWAAAGKDAGFTPAMLLDLLRRRGRYRPEDFARLHLTETVDLPKLKLRWLAALDGAEQFFVTRDPAEIGCLYYSRSLGRFVEPRSADEDVAPHYGCPGGALPADHS